MITLLNAKLNQPLLLLNFNKSVLCLPFSEMIGLKQQQNIKETFELNLNQIYLFNSNSWFKAFIKDLSVQTEFHPTKKFLAVCKIHGL